MNRMPAVAYATVIALAAIVALALSARLLATFIPGASVTSWWRSPWKNRDVGGLANSAHLFGVAVDLVPATGAVESAARGLYPVVVNEGDHIHAAFYKA